MGNILFVRFGARSFAFASGSDLIPRLLRADGHGVDQVVFLDPDGPLPEASLAAIDGFLADTPLALLSVYSANEAAAIALTRRIKARRPDLLVCWGGPHCIAAPERATRHADLVCVGEGDVCVRELADRVLRGQSPWEVPNLAHRRGGAHQVNRVLPPLADLDSLPAPDFDCASTYTVGPDGGLVPVDRDRLRSLAMDFTHATRVPSYGLVTSRGCPFTCDYCNNSTYLKLYRKSEYLRWHSVEWILADLERALAEFPGLQAVVLLDDDFLLRPAEQLARFAEGYRRRIGRPFLIQTSALTCDEARLRILLEAGLAWVSLGVQSGSQRILTDIYRRQVGVEAVRRALARLFALRDRHPFTVVLDFITDNPYEGEEDILATARFIAELPGHVRTNLFVLAFFPGTGLHARAVADGLLEEVDPFRGGLAPRPPVFQKGYAMLLLALVQRLRDRFPGAARRFYRAAARPWPRRLARRLPDRWTEAALRFVHTFRMPRFHRS